MKSTSKELKSMRINVSLDINDARDAKIINYLNKYGGKTFNAEFARTCMYLKILGELERDNVADDIANKVFELMQELSVPKQLVKDEFNDDEECTLQDDDFNDYENLDDDPFGMNSGYVDVED